ncbi:MAG TPA: pantoate--beta-alanine ligase [Bacteroidales bacterium]|nr:pantoate--beta-alanine ligase [Bacteroidales bacterium]
MLIAKTIKETGHVITNIRTQGKTIGFVPTMGALHRGHISLQEKSRQENDFTVCSIFVNPIQFNNPEDLKKYPRTEDKDLRMLEEAGCDLAFVPSVQEMYPEKNTTVYDFGHLDKVMEGKFRPGHFNGVAVVVKKLFDIIQPHRAYFGEKDFQQLAVIKALVERLKLPVEIIPCPTLRETSGLAMSSRNERLSPADRQTASVIYRSMCEAKSMVPKIQPAEIEQLVKEQINAAAGMQLEYFNLVDAQTLLPVKEWKPGQAVVGCVAAHIGGVRLIDNMLFFS